MNPLWNTAVVATERDTLWLRNLGWTSRIVCCKNIVLLVISRGQDRIPLAHRTVTSRDLEWWRHAEAGHAILKDKWSGVHSRRFNVWRWETPLEPFFGRVRREPGEAVTSKGWLLQAQNHEASKTDGWDFARTQLFFCRGSSISVASSICPASVCAQGVLQAYQCVVLHRPSALSVL